MFCPNITLKDFSASCMEFNCHDYGKFTKEDIKEITKAVTINFYKV